MMFTGGEQGIEDILPLLAMLKARREWTGGTVSWWIGDEVPDSVFGLTRSLGRTSTTVLANFSNTPVAVPLLMLGHPAILFAVEGGPGGSDDPLITSDEILLSPYRALVLSVGIANE